jgi:hypothetical protein
VEVIRIKGKKVIQPITKEDLTSLWWGCYGKQVEFDSGERIAWKNFTDRKVISTFPRGGRNVRMRI